ncbi:iron(III) transport system ATP-binding protein [Actinacidiphila yanglinensis]|uniref:ABC-type quaternary amine transporter n=1 Tax=Actinacidiphila yanglinensis TaxID=310779 RepID=A0A1H6DY79_9ACTN|nr:ABC transporter ATP-binding protein [Actinacidiphila yanglinensis]SEG89565.1 iron(III) transport system ATP-binding protein [Actinacidiphila yanglinensis]
MIEVRGLTKRYPGRTVSRNAVDGIDLDIPEGKLVTLLGPSGCGKTTTLRLIAGLERPDAGRIRIGDRLMCAPAEGVFVGVHQRPIGVVFQSYAVWPHMTAVQNVMFPLQSGQKRLPKAQARKRAMEALDLVGLAEFADRPAPALSGGQQQRVSLARALTREPEVLLLDEPLSNLDAGLRDRVRDEIRAVQLRLGITTVFVTHDQDEALAVSDEVIVMDSGRIVERGQAQDIYRCPKEEFTARFMGISNSLPGTVRTGAGEVAPADPADPGSPADPAATTDIADIDLAHGTLRCVTTGPTAAGDRVNVFIRPESLLLSRKDPSGRGWKGTVEFSIYHGDCWDYHVRVGDTLLRSRMYREKVGLTHGDPVFVVPEQDTAIAIPAAASEDAARERSALAAR